MAESKIPLPTYMYTRTDGNDVNLTSYTSIQNSYTFPYDGYLILDSGEKPNGIIHVNIQDNGGLTNVAFMRMNITGTYQTESLFVRKGMKCYVADRSSGTKVSFRALLY